MKILRLLIFSMVLMMGLISCQVQTPTPEAPEVEATLSLPEASETPIPAKETTINSENLGLLKIAASFKPTDQALECSWSADSSKVSVRDFSHVGLFDPISFTLLGEFTGDESTSLDSVSPASGLVAYSLDGITIQVYDIFTKADKFSFKPGFQYSNVFFSPNGDSLAISSLDLIEVVLYDTASGVEISRLSGFETAAPTYSARFSPDGSYLLWISRGTAQPMEIASQTLKPAVSHEDFIASAAMSHDNSKLATTAAGTLNDEFVPLVTVWNSQSGQVIWQKGGEEFFTAIEFSPDDSLLAVGNAEQVLIFDPDNGSELSRLQFEGDVVHSLSFSPDGQTLLVCGRNGNINIWKLIP